MTKKKSVILRKIIIKNFGPIVEDEVLFDPFTYFIGRNNTGKSHYLKAIEILLATRNPDNNEMLKLQNDKTKPIEIRGFFEGAQDFTNLVSQSKHKDAIDKRISNGVLEVVRILDPLDKENTVFGIPADDGGIHNPGGFTANLLKVLPEPLAIVATADTIDELKNKANTALSKLKKEVLKTFFESLREETEKALVNLDVFLHSDDEGRRSKDLISFEAHLKEELMGEFSEIIPSVEFDLPNEEIIAKEMKIFLDDGHRSEIEQKGHGLQRATLLAMLRLLAKHGHSYQDKPAPIFLIGEIETFLHPYAQKLLAEALDSLIDRYQIVTSTHSPFIVSPATISGYRRVSKHQRIGAKNIKLSKPKEVNLSLVSRHLERRGNLEGLFADRIILTEGNHDEGFFTKLMQIFGLFFPKNKFTLFVKAGGKEELRQARNFYRQMGFDDVAIVCDLDYLFSNDIKHLFKDEKIDVKNIEEFKKHIDWTSSGDPSLEFILDKINKKGYPSSFDQVISDLSSKRILTLKKGSPEMYYKNHLGEKNGWEKLSSENDLFEPEYLKDLIAKILT